MATTRPRTSDTGRPPWPLILGLGHSGPWRSHAPAGPGAVAGDRQCPAGRHGDRFRQGHHRASALVDGAPDGHRPPLSPPPRKWCQVTQRLPVTRSGPSRRKYSGHSASVTGPVPNAVPLTRQPA